MSRPLLISDCDEVLLNMLGPFGRWLDEAHAIDFDLRRGDFARSMLRRNSGEPVPAEEMWSLLDGFFTTEMHRQPVVPGAVEALGAIAEKADVVILTNLQDHFHAGRVSQLDAVGIRHRVVCNQGGKGEPVSALLAELRPSSTVFVDDLAHHHGSVAKHAPHVHRLHMIADPVLAGHFPPAPDAHARIDDWPSALPWVLDRLA